MKIAIMQPTYLPWAGYFAMIDQVDLFVVLEDVAVSPKSWQTRNRIRARDGNVVWLSVPSNARRGMALNDVRIVLNGWQRKHWRTIEAAYGRAPGWPIIADACDPLRDRGDSRLINLTGSLIVTIARTLGITTPIVAASTLGPTRPGRIERIIDICQLTDADTLLDAPGARAFLAQADLPDVKLEWHNHAEAPYDQGGQPWQPQLSVIDLLAWRGDSALDHLRSSDRTSTLQPGVSAT